MPFLQLHVRSVRLSIRLLRHVMVMSFRNRSLHCALLCVFSVMGGETFKRIQVLAQSAGNQVSPAAVAAVVACASSAVSRAKNSGAMENIVKGCATGGASAFVAAASAKAAVSAAVPTIMSYLAIPTAAGATHGTLIGVLQAFAATPVGLPVVVIGAGAGTGVGIAVAIRSRL